MAELPRTEPGSQPHPSNILSYGHFGTASYDPLERQWHFKRQHMTDEVVQLNAFASSAEDSPSPPFRLIGNLHEIQLNPTVAGCNISREPKNTTGIPHSTNSVLKHFPEVCAANVLRSQNQALVERSERDSGDWKSAEKIVFASAACLASESLQLDYGFVPITAFVTGISSKEITFRCLGREQVVIDDHSNSTFELTIPSLVSDNEVKWPALGVVHSLFVSNKSSDFRDTCIAALTSHGLSLFQPTFDRSATSRQLRANHILDIPVDRTGGVLHASAAFHPRVANTIAIIDREGNWSIWNIKKRHTTSTRKLQRARLHNSGSVPLSPSASSNSKTDFEPYPVGWHRIHWLGSAPNIIDRLLLCNQQAVFLLDLNGKVLQILDFRLASAFPKSHVLDVQPSQFLTGDCLILTTTHFSWMSVSERSDEDLVRGQHLRPVFSWNHFRSQLDSTLSMHVLESAKVSWIILTSSRGANMTVYRTFPSRVHQCTVSAPLMLRLPSTATHTPLRNVYFRTVQAEAKTSHGTQCWLFKLFWYQPGEAVEEGIFVVQEGILTEDESMSSRHQVDVPLLQTLQNRTARFVDDTRLNDFIMGDEEEFVPGNHYFNHLPHGPVPGRALPDGGDVIVNSLKPTYDAMVETSRPPGGSPSLTLHECLIAAKQTIADHEGGSAGQILSEVPTSWPYITEIEDDSETFRSCVDRLQLDPIHGISRGALHLEPLSQRTLIETYNDIAQAWMSTLPAEVPNRVRLFRERLARQMAFDVLLASYVIRKVASDDGEEAFHDGPEARAMVTPSERVGVSDDVNPLKSSQSWKTDQDHIEQAHTSGTALLESYATFEKSLPVIEPSNTLEKVICHLPQSIDADPADYNYSEIERRFTAAQLDREQQKLDPRARRKVERLARSRQKQIERQELAKQVTFDTRVMLPTITSSQLLPIRNAQSSQLAPPPGSSQTQISDMRPPVSMSQPERGHFGAREGRKGKRKKDGRNAGF